MNPPVNDRRHRALGRLMSLSNDVDGTKTLLHPEDASSSGVVIYFPSMPDVIELIRSAEYRTARAPFVPDGIHLYKWTNPIDIPFSFTLHAQDDYCSQGGVSLMAIAAKLHSLILPINTAKRGKSTLSLEIGSAYTVPENPNARSGMGLAPTTSAGATQLGTAADATARADATLTFTRNTVQSTTFYPPTCYLDLITIGDDTPTLGVRCVGYIKDVSVKFKGPWLRGSDSSLKNVPTSAEYSFKLVHNTSYSNFYEPAVGTQDMSITSAFANDVRDRLFNTFDMINDSRPKYQGFNEQPAQIAMPAPELAKPQPADPWYYGLSGLGGVK